MGSTEDKRRSTLLRLARSSTGSDGVTAETPGKRSGGNTLLASQSTQRQRARMLHWLHRRPHGVTQLCCGGWMDYSVSHKY